jgi:hypothetical protein
MASLRVVGSPHPDAVARLEPAARLETLEDIIHWGIAQVPALDVIDVIVQDEYNHDAIVRGSDVYLVFDTT